jgi:hypothetical protein
MIFVDETKNQDAINNHQPDKEESSSEDFYTDDAASEISEHLSEAQIIDDNSSL